MRVRGFAAIALGALALLPAGAAEALTTPQLTAAASGGGEIDDARLVDTATLSGSAAATGSITFDVFGPDDPSCAGEPLDSSTASVAGDGEYASWQEYPDTVGTYRFVASYSGDANNAAVATDCADPAQEAAVAPATPTLVSTASPGVPVGQPINDAARLTEAYVPTGEIAFQLYGPDDADCSQAPIATSTAPLADDDRVTSAAFTPAAPGVYRWIASYAGDARNLPASGVCGDAGESVTVSAPSVSPAPGLTVRGSAPATVGGQISATATLSSVATLIGSLTFRVYGPDDAGCVRGAVSASTRLVFGAGDYASDPFTPKEPGTYRWVVGFSADDGATTSTSCGDPAAAVAVARAPDPAPELGRSFTVSDVSGTVLVKVAAAAAGRRAAAARGIGFVEVHGTRKVPVGSTIDASDGTAGLAAAAAGATDAVQTAELRGSPFVARQASGDASVELELRSSARKRARCEAAAGRRPRAARRRTPPPDVLRKLYSKVRGHFHIRARYSSASARHARWTTVERCDGTLTQVGAGAVRVADRRRHRSVTLHAGGRYLARSPS
jgi:hypothetical protein